MLGFSAFVAGFSEFPLLTEIIRANYDYWKEENDLEEANKANADKKQIVATSSSLAGSKDTLKEATEEEETTAESSHRPLEDIPSIDDDH